MIHHSQVETEKRGYVAIVMLMMLSSLFLPRNLPYSSIVNQLQLSTLVHHISPFCLSRLPTFLFLVRSVLIKPDLSRPPLTESRLAKQTPKTPCALMAPGFLAAPPTPLA